MADDLTADDLRRGASEVARDNGYPEEANRLSVAADLMDQGWRLAPPLQPGTVTVNVDDLARVALLIEAWAPKPGHPLAASFRAALAEADRDR